MKIRKIAQTPGLVATVVDNLTSSSTIDALSANQGRVLNEKITNLTTYSTEEVKTGETWIDGKPIYRKVVYVNNLANNTVKTVSCNIGANIINQMVKQNLIWYDSADKTWINNERWDSTSIRIEYHYNVASDVIWINSVGTNWSSRTSKAYAILEYTKTTD